MSWIEKTGVILMIGAVCLGTVDTDWHSARAILQVVFLVAGVALFGCAGKG